MIVLHQWGVSFHKLGCLTLQKQVRLKDNSEATMIVDVENVKLKAVGAVPVSAISVWIPGGCLVDTGF